MRMRVKYALKIFPDFITYISMFLMFAYWPGNYLGTSLINVIVIGLLGLVLLYKRRAISRKLCAVLLLFLGLHILSIIFGSFYWQLDMRNITALLVSVVFISIYSLDEFANKYTKILFFLSAYSLVTYVLYFAKPGWFQGFPLVKATDICINTFFSLLPTNMVGYYRNFGCWGEPGMFAVYLTVSLFFELFYKKETNFIHLIILTIAMVTTFSTSGYLAYILLWGGFVLNISDKRITNVSKRQKRVIIGFILVVALGFIYLYASGKLGNRALVFKKLNPSRNEATTSERLTSILIAWNTMWNFFPFGAGWGNYVQNLFNGHILVTTPLNWFAVYGFIYGLLMNYGVFMYIYNLVRKRTLALMIWGGLMCCYVSQDLSSIFIGVVPAMYYLSGNVIRTKKVENDGVFL